MTDGVLRGSGAINWFMASTFADLFLRVALAALLSGPIGLGSLGIWLSWPVGWTIGALLSLGFYFAGVWKRTADIA